MFGIDHTFIIFKNYFSRSKNKGRLSWISSWIWSESSIYITFVVSYKWATRKKYEVTNVFQTFLQKARSWEKFRLAPWRQSRPWEKQSYPWSIFRGEVFWSSQCPSWTSQYDFYWIHSQCYQNAPPAKRPKSIRGTLRAWRPNVKINWPIATQVEKRSSDISPPKNEIRCPHRKEVKIEGRT